MTLTMMSAGYNPCYDPSTCNDGGGYWQPYGVAMVELDNGDVLVVELDDTSCGDFGERWTIVVRHEDKEYIFGEDDVSGHDSYDDNNHSWNMMMNDLGVDANVIIEYAASAINDAAWDKYYKEN